VAPEPNDTRSPHFWLGFSRGFHNFHNAQTIPASLFIRDAVEEILDAFGRWSRFQFGH
jgi:hypothetical protein